MNPRITRVLLAILATGVLSSASAQAQVVSVDLCVEFQTNYTDLGGDFWPANDNRPGRGVWLSVWDWSAGVEMFPTHYTDWVQGNGGCTTLSLDTTHSYLIYTQSQASVNGVEINSYDDMGTRDLAAYVHYAAYVPTVATTLALEIPADTQHGQLAVATWAFYRDNPGLAGDEALIEFFDDGCCNGGAEIQASSTSKFIIGHELGHGVGYRRDWSTGPQFDYNAPEDGCDGDNVAQNQHAQVSKEFQSAAAVEGWADFYSAWIWNRNSENDCIYDRHYSSDFDMGGVTDTTNGQVSCEGIPTSGVDPAFVSDPSLTNITAHDWVSDVVNAGMCAGPTTNRGTQYDWLRYWWDMVTDENVALDSLVDVYDLMDPRSWDANGSTATASDDPVSRLVNAATALGLLNQHNNQAFNGVNH